MKINGSCHCGAIAFEADIDPRQASLCNCTDCQSFSGAPFRASVPAQAESFRVLQGQPKIYVKTADSGKKRAQAFCAECGSPIYASDALNPARYNLRLGTIKQRDKIPALKQIWRDSALAWAQDIHALPATQKEWSAQ